MSSLQCALVSRESQTVYVFRPDDAKKSAFWLDDDEKDGARREATAPAECRIERCPQEEAGAADAALLHPQFYVGGFQLVSNAKMIEVYLNDDQYLTTCRGIPSAEHRTAIVADDSSRRYYKTVYVVPGGPRPVRNVVLKLRSLVPADQQVVRLVMIKLTARLLAPTAPGEEAAPSSSASSPPVATESLSPTSPSGSSAVPPAATAAPAGLLSDIDVPSLVTGLSLMIKGTEERVMRSTTQKVCHELRPCFASIQAQLQGLSTSVTNQLDALQSAVLRQQQLLESQQRMLQLLAEQQVELKQLLLVERQCNNNPVAKSQTDEQGLDGKMGPCHIVELDTRAEDSFDDAEQDADATTEDVVQNAAAEPTESNRCSNPTSSNADGDGCRDENPYESLDELLERAFPIAITVAAAAAAADPPPGPAHTKTSPQSVVPVTTVMRAADLMNAGDGAADDDPFVECAAEVSPSTSSLGVP